LDGDIGRLVVASGQIWSATAYNLDAIVRLDERTGAVVQTVTTPSTSDPWTMSSYRDSLLVAGVDGLWLVHFANGGTTGPFGDTDVKKATQNSDGAWLISGTYGNATLERWNADWTEMEFSVHFPHVPNGFLAVGGGVYIGTEEGLMHFDSNGNHVSTIDVANALGLTLGPDGRLWMADFDKGDVVSVDTASDRIVGSVDLGTVHAKDVAVGADAIYAVNDTKLFAIDPATMTITAAVPTKKEANSVEVIGDRIWVGEDGCVQIVKAL
jgi:hypothetical protein